MATVITHAVAAGALAIVGPDDVSRLRLTVTLAVLAMVPDLDVLAFRLGIPYADMFGHRGITHSILFAAIAGVLTPSVVFPKVKAFGRSWVTITLLAFAATMSHGVLDAFTDAGLGVGFLIPFDDTRYFAPWRPIATSPVGIRTFFEGGAAASILANEVLWVGSPLVMATGVAYVVRRRRRGG